MPDDVDVDIHLAHFVDAHVAQAFVEHMLELAIALDGCSGRGVVSAFVVREVLKEVAERGFDDRRVGRLLDQRQDVGGGASVAACAGQRTVANGASLSLE